MIEALANVCKDHHAQLASTLVQIFCQYNRIIPITTACIAKSIEKEGVCVCVCVEQAAKAKGQVFISLLADCCWIIRMQLGSLRNKAIIKSL